MNFPESEGWDAYKTSLDAYRANQTPETQRILIASYEAWGVAFGLSASELKIEVEKFRRALMAEQRKRAA